MPLVICIVVQGGYVGATTHSERSGTEAVEGPPCRVKAMSVFSPEKMMMVFFIALLVLGPEKLPEMARKFGKVMGELRKLSGGFQNEIRQAVNQATTEDTNSSSSSQSLTGPDRGTPSVPSTPTTSPTPTSGSTAGEADEA